MNRLIEITLISTILLLIAYAAGCKNEVDYDPNEFIFELYSTDSNYTDISFSYDNNNGVTKELTLNVIDGEIVCSQSPKKAIEIIFKTLCKAYNIREVEDWPVRFEEPNEPNEPILTKGYTFNIWEPNDINIVSLDFIPTWPDYIELEKDLIVDPADPNENWFCIYPKGTKIYFQENE